MFVISISTVPKKLFIGYVCLQDVKNPDGLSWDERKTQRLSQEENAFDSDHYLCDFFEPEDIEHMWTSKSIWSRGRTKIFNGGRSEIEKAFVP